MAADAQRQRVGIGLEEGRALAAVGLSWALGYAAALVSFRTGMDQARAAERAAVNGAAETVSTNLGLLGVLASARGLSTQPGLVPFVSRGAPSELTEGGGANYYRFGFGGDPFFAAAVAGMFQTYSWLDVQYYAQVATNFYNNSVAAGYSDPLAYLLFDRTLRPLAGDAVLLQGTDADAWLQAMRSIDQGMGTLVRAGLEWLYDTALNTSAQLVFIGSLAARGDVVEAVRQYQAFQLGVQTNSMYAPVGLLRLAAGGLDALFSYVTGIEGGGRVLGAV